MSEVGIACHVCGGGVELISEFTDLRRVTSDCKPWPAGGQLGVCQTCATVVKVVDATWQGECDAIYTGYTIYHTSGGTEQKVFTTGDGQASSRSAMLVERLRDRVGLPARGRLLDVGCGNGALLRSFSQIVPGWSLAGSELNDKYRSVIEQIPGIEQLYTCALEEIPGTFDVITLLHCLEHVPAPVQFLQRLQAKLNPGGIIVVEVPDHVQNPFDLLIADHCTHFSKQSLVRTYERANMGVVAAADDWIAKELTVVGRKGAAPEGTTKIDLDPQRVLDAVRTRIDWLASLPRKARQLTPRGKLGLFGTSIAGTWLGSELEDVVAFYVDEDASRVGNTLADRPIVSPAGVPAEAQVFLGVSPVVAQAIKRRMEATGHPASWHLPPVMARSA